MNKLTLYTPTLVFKFSQCSLCISYGTEKENLFGNQLYLELVTISFILMTFTFDARVIQ